MIASIALAAWAAAFALPAAAPAQAPDRDSYLYAPDINSPGQNLPSANGLGPFISDTTGAGLQADLFNPPISGGLFENRECTSGFGSVFYGATEWWDFYPHRNGRISIRVDGVAPFRPVAAIMPFDGDGDPVYNELACLDANSATGVVFFDFPTLVQAGRGYSIQVGGAKTPNADGGTPSQGEYSLQLFYDPDSDGDGLLDSGDQCDGEGGPANLGGCPDNDGDGIRNADDRCIGEQGPAPYRGCPDADGDGIANPDDRCAAQRGPAQLQGCPDGDGDGRPDIDDRCDGEDASARDKNKDGCLDTLLLHRQANVSLDVGAYASGIIVRSLAVTRVPAGARVIVTCRRPGGTKCGGLKMVAKAARRIPVRGLKNKRLPWGSQITIRVTAKKATGKYIRLTVVRSGGRVARVDRCTNRGSKKLRKKGCS